MPLWLRWTVERSFAWLVRLPQTEAHTEKSNPYHVMQFVTGGPNIPLDIITAQEEGRLAIICGAGISMPAGLPSFKKLVEDVVKALGGSLFPVEQNIFDEGNYDRVLGLLESDRRFGPQQVRHAVQKILTTPSAPDLRTHTALLDLADSRDRQLRLVTTNFDLLFEEAKKDLRFSAAPTLSIPKPHKWNSLVYLHGRIDAGDPDGRNLVLTSADFGSAYLLERWASRFVCELFNHFTVLFVGYSLNDPVMRYLIDALAAERRTDGRIHSAYALASYNATDPGNHEATRQEWSAKGIEPILYNDKNDHVGLHQTLSKWASIWKGGFSSKKQLVLDIGTKDPDALPPDEIDRFCWALSDSSGVTAGQLSELGTNVSLKWLNVFEKHGLLNGITSPQVYTGRNAITTHIPTELDRVAIGMTRWLAHHWQSPELILWVVRSGGYIHPEFSFSLHSPLLSRPDGGHTDSKTLDPFKRIWWALIAMSGQMTDGFLHDDYWLINRVKSGEQWLPSLRTEVLARLTPRLHLRPSFSRLVSDLTENDDSHSISRASDLVSVECNSQSSISSLAKAIRKHPEADRILIDLAFDLTSILRRCMDSYAALDDANEDWDPSYFAQPSIAPHAQNTRSKNWAHLIELVRDAFDLLRQENPRKAQLLADVWIETPYPLFRRLALYGSSTAEIPSASQIAGLIVADPVRWMWHDIIQVEFYRLLPRLWQAIGNKTRDQITEIILSGPPRNMYRDNLSDDELKELKELKDREVWNILARLDRQNLLDENTKQELQAIENRRTTWKLTGEEREDFPSWHESRSGYDTDFTKDDLLNMTPNDLAEALITHTSNRGGLLEEWGKVCSEHPRLGLDTLAVLQDNNAPDKNIFERAFRGLSRSKNEDMVEMTDDMLQSIEHLPDTLLINTGLPVAQTISRIAIDAPITTRQRILQQWDRLIPTIRAPSLQGDADWVSHVLNSTTEVLSVVLFNLVHSDASERDAGLPHDIATRLEQLMALPEPSRNTAAASIAQYLPLLFYIAPDWVRDHVLPLFDWETSTCPEAAWQGFLSNPSMSGPLWDVMKQDFLNSFQHVDKLERDRQALPQLLAAVALQIPDSLTSNEANAALRALDDEGRAETAQWIYDRLKSDSEQAAELWTQSIGPWIRTAWPRDLPSHGPRSSAKLAMIPLTVGEAFPDAVQTVIPLISPIQNEFSVAYDLSKAAIIHQHPLEALQLLHAVTSDTPTLWLGKVRTCLDQIRMADASLVDNPMFRKVEDIVERHGLR